MATSTNGRKTPSIKATGVSFEARVARVNTENFKQTDRRSLSRVKLLEQAMRKIEFHEMKEPRHKAELLAMMRSLYSEDPGASVDPSRFPLTIDFLFAHPLRGRIVLFTQDGSIRGYALLIPYWSNEFGGTLLYVDEIFVIAEARNAGIGRSFFKFLEETRPFEAVALALEVSPDNVAARRLYESLGFSQRSNSTLTYRFPEFNRK
jgi:ribosomal protein S18 acetylase RimI-like enzyme